MPPDPPKKPSLAALAKAAGMITPTDPTAPRKLGRQAPDDISKVLFEAATKQTAYAWAYIVCYDLKSPAIHYVALFEELKRSEAWWHYLESTWIVVRREVLVTFASRIRPLIYQPDRLLIMPAKGPADGWLPEEAWKWISERVPREW